jgi:hypothetical protein
MPSHYWIKLYHEILDDPKMGRLPDRLWRRAIELFLLAGEMHNNGDLPSAVDMAWKLRTSKDELMEDLLALGKVGIVTLNDNCWHVVNFSKRQAAVDNAQRQRQYRNKQRMSRDSSESITKEKIESNESITDRNADTDIDIDTEEIKNIGTPSAATAPPSEPKPKRKPSPKQQEAQEMFTALAEVCQINLTTLTGTQRKQLNQSEKILRKDDAVPADMEPFAVWWYANDWRGKKGDVPRPAQVRETWGKFKAWREGGQQYGQRTQSTDPRAPNYRPPLIGGLNA